MVIGAVLKVLLTRHVAYQPTDLFFCYPDTLANSEIILFFRTGVEQ